MANISPSDLPVVGSIPRAVGFCKDINGNIIWDDGSNFDNLSNQLGQPSLTSSKLVVDWSLDYGAYSVTNGTFAIDSTVTLAVNGKSYPTAKATSNGTSPFTGTYTFTNPISFSLFENIVIPMRITSNETASGIGTSAIKLVATTSTGKTISLGFHTIDMAPGQFYAYQWNRADDATNSNFFTYTGGATIDTFDSESITKLELTFTASAGSTAYPVWLGPIKLNCKSTMDKGIISWHFDGPYPSHLTIANILAKYNLYATFAVRNELIDNASGLSLADMNKIYAAGHDFVHHTYAASKTNGYVNATDWPTAKSITDDINNQDASFAAKGWHRGRKFMVRGFSDLYPAAGSLARQVLVRDAIAASGILLMRGGQTVVSRKIPVGYGAVGNPEILKYNLSTSDTTTLSNLTTLIDQVAANKSIATILCHGIDGGVGNQGLSSAIFEAAIAYQVSKPVVHMKLPDIYWNFFSGR